MWQCILIGRYFSSQDCYHWTSFDNTVLMKFFLPFERYETCKFLCYLTYLENTCSVFLLNDDPGKPDCGYSL